MKTTPKPLRSLAMALALFTVCGMAGAADPPVMPWNLDTLSQAPKEYPAPGFDEKGVRALFYDGLPFNGKPTRVFAWYGVPEGKEGTKYPAMVLVHGGGGTAFAEWVRLWTGRGYAAIAMDTCGCVPKGKYSDWERHPDGGPAGWGDFEHAGAAPEEQWSYHAVADVVLAHSLIRSYPEVDADRTGVTGISWGGYLTCITAGVDPRFKLAVPVYGCGFLGEDSAWLDAFAGMGPEKAGRWLGLWDPSVYLGRARMPLLWVTGTNDFAYPMGSLQKSYRLPQGPRHLCVRIRMPHGHGGAGENPEEIRVFAESLLNGGKPLPKITAQSRDDSSIWVTYAAETPVSRAELTYTKARGKWQDRLWESIPATVHADRGAVEATLPEGVTAYYVNLFDDRDCAVSTEHEETVPESR